MRIVWLGKHYREVTFGKSTLKERRIYYPDLDLTSVQLWSNQAEKWLHMRFTDTTLKEKR